MLNLVTGLLLFCPQQIICGVFWNHLNALKVLSLEAFSIHRFFFTAIISSGVTKWWFFWFCEMRMFCVSGGCRINTDTTTGATSRKQGFWGFANYRWSVHHGKGQGWGVKRSHVPEETAAVHTEAERPRPAAWLPEKSRDCGFRGVQGNQVNTYVLTRVPKFTL